MSRAPTTLPPADPWQRIAPGLRARRLDGGGVELQHVANVHGATEPVSLTTWALGEATLIELVLFASAYHGQAAATAAMARVHLARFLHGKDQP